MTEEGARYAVRELHEIALDIRVLRNAIKPTAPKDALTSLANTASALDTVARDLLSEFGVDMPEGVL